MVRDRPTYPFEPVQVSHKLDQNENPYDFPEALKAEATRRMLSRAWNRYPDLYATRLREAVARYEGWDAAGVVLTPGSNVLIKMLTELAGLGQTVLTTSPTFAVYPSEATLLEAKLVQVPLRSNFSLDVPALKAALHTETSGLLALAQPHAPTGYLDRPQDVQELVEEAEACGWVTLLDEAYHQYAGRDYRELVRGHPHALSLRTFSKAWGLAGLRLGYLLTSPQLAAQVYKVVPAFNIGVLSECALEVALEHPDYVQRRVQETVRERERVLAALAGHPTLEVFGSAGNFFMVRAADAGALHSYLLGQSIAVRPQKGVPGLEHILRVSLGSPESNDALLAALLAWR